MYVPATVKLRTIEALCVAGMSATFAPAGSRSNVTVCATLSKVHVMLPVPPERPMVTLCGLNDSDAAAVTLPVGGGVLTTSCAVPECVMLPETIVAVIVVEPFATPEATPLAASRIMVEH